MYRVTRVKKGERRFLGVVGGIVKHLNVDADPFWPRIAVFLSCIIQPIFFLVYLGLALALPEETYEIPDEAEEEPKNFKDFQEKESAKTEGESSEISENE